ncbi:MAG TPA: hypothetical protein P5518_07970 [Candidatus Cloacimonas sp.]|jgi:hypothetical protein|nr:hypothetical protein [Candidatus Cloacimonas sp.]HOU26310.1 hypothetical protein [Candidatus Cloacimonas sp.]HPH71806.1 hypothetical protein [Candidatus Cloacimonas sp.]HPZ02565.1 hypothetical protein [Candidatus Cloacimonas sp.]HRR01242.1 hypothetical protein [Candidatus Cloacimonas sp.]
MRKIQIVLILITALIFSACCHNKAKPVTSETENLNYTGSKLKSNYIWGGAMNLAWNELIENFTGEPIELATKDENALKTLHCLNNPVFTKDDIDEASYYVKSGYGQKTVDLINQECRAKFPDKSISDLQLKLADKDIISYAYFLKQIEYEIAFKKQAVNFLDKQVKGFTSDPESYTNVYIVNYENDDKFLLALKLKDNQDQIFLAKGYPMDKPDEVLKMLKTKAPANEKADFIPGTVMNRRDIFQAPVLHLNYERQYKEMLNKKIKNKKLSGYQIALMQEIIKFDMDEKGARVENEAIIGMITSANPNASKPKNLILDKPYWVIMKRANSNNPYFILGVGDTELMNAAE